MIKLIVLTFFSVFFFETEAFAAPTCSGKKILLCHKEGKSSKDAKEICVDISAIDGHLKNHELDMVGSCSQFDPALITTYACNAGLKYNVNLSRTCIRYDEGGVIASDCGTSANCSCSENPATDDSYRLNNIRYSTADYQEDFSSLNFIERLKVASVTQAYNQITTNLGSQVLMGNSALQFNLGTDRYGAEYFVDMCIRNENEYPSQTPLNLTGNILYAGGSFSSVSYPQSSKLSHRLSVYCDEGTTGNYSLASNPFFSQSEIPFMFGQRDFSSQIEGSRFCIVRHFFKENQTQKLRNNAAKKAIFQTTLNIAGDTSSTAGNEPIKLCRVTEIKKNNYACTSINFTNSAAMKDFILTNYGQGNSSQFQQDFKDVYNSACPNPCRAL
jgi:hypothetical protein